MNGFQAFEIDKQIYVLTFCDRLPRMQNANFSNTGMALCGKLKKGQTIEQFKEQYNAKKPTKKQLENVND